MKEQNRHAVDVRVDVTGVTLVELMIVLTLIAAIMAIVAINVSSVMEEADIKVARMDARKISEVATTYYVQSSPRRYPETLAELTAGPRPLLDETPVDPWGNPYVYEAERGTFVVFSRGPDGQEGTADDVYP